MKSIFQYPLCFLCLSILYSCAAQKPFEGVLSYKTEEKLYAQTADSIHLVKHYVKGDKVATVSQSNFGGQKYIRDTKNNVGTLLLKFNGQKFALTQDLTQDTIKKHFTIEKGKGKKKFAGLKSQHYLISGEYLDSAVHVYLCSKFPSNIVSIYGGLKGLPTKYTLLIKNEPIEYELVKVEEIPIESSLFEIPADYKVMSMRDFLDKMLGSD